jgi:hypothetical protein
MFMSKTAQTEIHIVMLSVINASVIMPSVIMLNVNAESCYSVENNYQIHKIASLQMTLFVLRLKILWIWKLLSTV